eukprot:gene9896-biopygen4742
MGPNDPAAARGAPHSPLVARHDHQASAERNTSGRVPVTSPGVVEIEETEVSWGSVRCHPPTAKHNTCSLSKVQVAASHQSQRCCA